MIQAHLFLEKKKKCKPNGIGQDATKVTVQQLLEEVSNLKNDFTDKNLEVKNQIGTLTDNDKSIQEDMTGLENQVSNLEDLSKLTVTETCLELKNYGLTVSKEFDLDPDGIN